MSHLTLDERIESLSDEIDGRVRSEFQSTLRTLRDAENPRGVILSLSRLGLLLMDRVYSGVGRRRPSDNLYHCIVAAGPGDGAKIDGLEILPDEMATYLHAIRTLSNKADHAAESVELGTDDAENSLAMLLRVGEWIYCRSRHGPQLPTIYCDRPHPPLTLVEAFRLSQETNDAELGRLREELSELRSRVTPDFREDDESSQSMVGSLRQAALTHFKDRTQQVQELLNYVLSSDLRFIVLSGRGGMGKTALATKLIQVLQYPNGTPLIQHGLETGGTRVVYLSLRDSENRSPDKIAQMICRVLPPSEAHALQSQWKKQTSISDSVEFLFRVFAERSLLLVLDNFEDVLNSDNHIANEYSNLGGFIELGMELDHRVRIVATSRRSVVFSPEVEGRIGYRCVELPLEDGLPTDDAVDLLRELDVDGRLALKSAVDEVLQTLARRCFGIPRTLETVVGTLRQKRTWNIDRLLTNENQLKQLISNPSRELYGSLAPDEQLVMQTLALYGRPSPPLAVKYLLPGLDVDEILDVLVRNYVAHFDGQHFGLHPLDNEFAYNQIPESGECHTRGKWHMQAAAYYREIGAPVASWDSIDDAEPQLQEFEHLIRAEAYDDACGLLNNICSGNVSMWGHSALVLQLAAKLDHKVTDRHLLATNLNYQGLAHRCICDGHASIQCFEEALRLARLEEDSQLASRCLRGLGTAYWVLGRPQESIAYVEQAIALHRSTGDREGLARCSNYLGLAYSDLGQSRKAIAHFEESMQVARELGAPDIEDCCLGNIGLALTDLGYPGQARRYLEESIQLASSIGDRLIESRSQSNLAIACCHMGLPHEALVHLERAMATMHEVGDRAGEGYCLAYRGIAELELGRVPRSIASLEKALEIADALDDRWNVCYASSHLGRAYQLFGNYDCADAHLTTAQEVAHGLGNRRQLCHALTGMAELAVLRAEFTRCQELCEEAIDLVGDSEDGKTLAELLFILGYAYHHSGHTSEAARAYERALKFEVTLVSPSASVFLGILTSDESPSDSQHEHLAGGLWQCESLLEKTPDLIKMAYLRAAALLAMGRTEHAVSAYKHALAQCSDSGIVWAARQQLGLLSRIPDLSDVVSEAVRILETQATTTNDALGG